MALRDSILALRRRRYAARCPFTAIVDRREGTPNGMGGISRGTTTATESDLLCGVDSVRLPKEDIEGGRPVAVSLYNIFLAHVTRDPESFDVLLNDEITVTTPTGTSQYRVVSTDGGINGAVCLTVAGTQIR